VSYTWPATPANQQAPGVEPLGDLEGSQQLPAAQDQSAQAVLANRAPAGLGLARAISSARTKACLAALSFSAKVRIILIDLSSSR